jgi:hypothetical protein
MTSVAIPSLGITYAFVPLLDSKHHSASWQSLQVGLHDLHQLLERDVRLWFNLAIVCSWELPTLSQTCRGSIHWDSTCVKHDTNRLDEKVANTLSTDGCPERTPSKAEQLVPNHHLIELRADLAIFWQAFRACMCLTTARSRGGAGGRQALIVWVSDWLWEGVMRVGEWLIATLTFLPSVVHSTNTPNSRWKKETEKQTNQQTWARLTCSFIHKTAGASIGTEAQVTSSKTLPSVTDWVSVWLEGIRVVCLSDWLFDWYKFLQSFIFTRHQTAELKKGTNKETDTNK